MGTSATGITLSDSYPSDPNGVAVVSPANPTAWTADANITTVGQDFTVYVICVQ